MYVKKEEIKEILQKLKNKIESKEKYVKILIERL